jgi:hypothetical protein
MPGFLGGSSSGTGGEIRFPAEFIDPVTKLRVSEPQTLIDTDFEYGLQPTKWETVELINNTPSFFSKGGDTTIPNISSITTTELSREVKVTTSLAHGLAVGIPINVSGTKSLTADGAYIINSVPDIYTFTYLCKQNQLVTASIEDLYTSIVTGEFFQGSQIRIADSDGLVTDAQSNSTLTIKTESPHGFGVNTPFYFLNLNSTVSQEFDSSNTSAKAFDSSNSATAQTFDGSNTLTSYRLDLDNNAVSSGTVSSISTYSSANNTITVSHTTENFVGKAIGTPLYHNVVTAGGYFATTPRGVVFLKALNTSTVNGSVFQVSDTPNGNVIPITNALTGTFQLANEARLFAGNNIDVTTETSITVVDDAVKTADLTNSAGKFLNNCSFSGSNISGASGSGLADVAWYQGAMLKYETTGTPPTINSGGDATAGGSTTSLVNGRTYFVDTFFQQGSTTNYSFTMKEYPTSSTVINTTSAGTGTHKFTQIGLAIDKDIIHVKDHGYVAKDMLRYDYPASGHFVTSTPLTEEKDYYFVETVYGSHNFNVNWTIGELSPKTQEFIGLTATQSSVTTLMNAVGFTGTTTYSVSSGTLPPGLTLNTSTGVITGTPNIEYATQTIRITVVDQSGSTDFVDIKFQVNPAPYLYAFSTATFGANGATGQDSGGIAAVRASLGSPAWANTYLDQPQVNGYYRWTVPQTATYQITAVGAGTDTGYSYGAVVQQNFALTQGEYLTLAVGQRSSKPFVDCGSGPACGAGGSFVARGGDRSTATPLIIAGGAAGTDGGQGTNTSNNANGNFETNNCAGSNYAGQRRCDGQGGPGVTPNGYWSAGGGGFYSDGASNSGWHGKGFRNNLRGGDAQSNGVGGFGGGAGGHACRESQAGGGYSGGYGGSSSSRGGGGGSYSATGSFTVARADNYGNGYITITKL